MRLTVYTDYALRVLMYLAVHPEPMPTIGEIAASYGISRNHLMKVVYELATSGFVETVRGKNGGLRLARPAADVSLGQVVRQTEPDFALFPCFEPNNASCVLSPACRLRAALHEAEAAFLDVLNGYALSDLVENQTMLSALLNRAAPSPTRGARRQGRNPDVPPPGS